jgi:hypothetical protein
MAKSYYFIPGFDPAGPSRYITLFRDALRQLAAPHAINIRCVLNLSSNQCYWNQYELGLGQSLHGSVDLYIADYTRTIRQHWDYSFWRLYALSFLRLAEFIAGGFAYCFPRDYRVACMTILQLILMQSVALIPIATFAMFVIGPGQAMGGPLFFCLSIVILSALSFASWKIIDFFKIPWLFKAFLFQRRLSESGDLTLCDAAGQLSLQLQHRQAIDNMDEIYLVSHSSGISLLLLVISHLEKTASSPLLRKIRIITYGRSMPFFLGRNDLRASLVEILNSSSYPWTDIVGKDDYLSDSLVPPYRYLDPRVGSSRYPFSYQVNYRKYPDVLDWAGKRPIVLVQQFSIHFDYLTFVGFPSLSEIGSAASMPLLLWADINHRHNPRY